MGDFTKKQILNFYDWKLYHGKILSEDAPQNLHENALHHISCIDRIKELEAACSSCYDAQQRASEEVERLQAAYKHTVEDNEELIIDLDAARAQLEAVTEERDEFQHSFNVRWDADMRAIKRWQKDTGKELTWPDHADMVVWLLEQLEAVKSLVSNPNIYRLPNGTIVRAVEVSRLKAAIGEGDETR
jgi:hypothetical protein